MRKKDKKNQTEVFREAVTKASKSLLRGVITLTANSCIVVILLESRVSTIELRTAASLLVAEMLACIGGKKA